MVKTLRFSSISGWVPGSSCPTLFAVSEVSEKNLRVSDGAGQRAGVRNKKDNMFELYRLSDACGTVHLGKILSVKHWDWKEEWHPSKG